MNLFCHFCIFYYFENGSLTKLCLHSVCSSALIPHGGCPGTSGMEINKAFVAEDPSTTIKELSTVLDLAYSSVQKILYGNLRLGHTESDLLQQSVTCNQGGQAV